MKKLQKDATYTFYVRAVNKVGKKSYYGESKEVEATTGFCAPKNLRVTNQSVKVKGDVLTQQFTVKWDKVPGAKKYYVYGTRGYQQEKLLGIVTKNSFTVKLNMNKSEARWDEYSKIHVYVKEGTDKYGTYLYEGLRPEMKQPKVTLSEKTSSSVKVNWKSVAGADTYILYRVSMPDFAVEKLGTFQKEIGRAHV